MLLVVEFENHLHNHQLSYSDKLKMLVEWVGMQIVEDNLTAVGDTGKLVVGTETVDIDLVQQTMDIGQLQLLEGTWMDLERTDWTEVGTDQVVVVDTDLLEEDTDSVEGSQVDQVDKHLALDNLVDLHYHLDMMDRAIGSQVVAFQVDQGIPNKKKFTT